LAALVGLTEHLHHFLFQLLQGCFELRELEQLGLRTDHATFQVFDNASLVLQFGFLAFGSLLKSHKLGFVAAVFFVQPGSHLR
jgi:hypothetical protein